MTLWWLLGGSLGARRVLFGCSLGLFWCSFCALGVLLVGSLGALWGLVGASLGALWDAFLWLFGGSLGALWALLGNSFGDPARLVLLSAWLSLGFASSGFARLRFALPLCLSFCLSKFTALFSVCNFPVLLASPCSLIRFPRLRFVWLRYASLRFAFMLFVLLI